jgi:hypothetical protein
MVPWQLNKASPINPRHCTAFLPGRDAVATAGGGNDHEALLRKKPHAKQQTSCLGFSLFLPAFPAQVASTRRLFKERSCGQRQRLKQKDDVAKGIQKDSARAKKANMASSRCENLHPPNPTMLSLRFGGESATALAHFQLPDQSCPSPICTLACMQQ